LDSKEIAAVIKSVVGLSIPDCRKFLIQKDFQIYWMSHDELLVKGAYNNIRSTEIKLTAKLKNTHSSVINISDSRTFFDIEGSGVQNVLGKLCPVDLSPTLFKVGDFRRTRMAQASVALSFLSPDKFQVMCFTSVKDYIYKLLEISTSKGSEVNFY
jgi:sarcosine oxidase subunit gamma